MRRPRMMTRAAPIVAPAMVAVLIVAACSGSGSTSSTSDSAAEEPATPENRVGTHDGVSTMRDTEPPDEFAAADATFRSGPFAPADVGVLLDRWSAQIEPLVVEASETHDDAPTIEAWRAAVDELFDDFVVPAGLER